MKTYPSKWYRVEQRGCTPNAEGCQHLDWPLERCDVTPKRTVTRHVFPKDFLQQALDSQLFAYRAIRLTSHEWSASGLRSRKGRAVRVTGLTERQALQNLCAQMRVVLP